MIDYILIAGAGVDCNGEYKPLYDLKTNFDRVWMLGDTYRIYYHDGWKLANGDITKIYYKLVGLITAGETTIVKDNGVGILNPWDTVDCKWVAVDSADAPVPTVTTHKANNSLIEEYTEEDDEGNSIDVRKITDLSTGYVRYEKVITKEVQTPVITNHDRYFAPMLTLGRVYQFSFVRDFAELGYNPDNENEDPLKGLYKVDRLISFFDLATTGIDLYKNLYKPLGLSEELYNKDMHKICNMMVYKLVDVTDPTIQYYMPMTFILGTPNGRVNQYSKILLSMRIGEHFDLEMLTDMQEIFKNVLEAKWGIKSDASLAVYDKVWMPEAYFETLIEDREEVKKAMYREHGDVLADTLFYVQSNKLYRENNELIAKLNSYEEILEQTQ